MGSVPADFFGSPVACQAITFGFTIFSVPHPATAISATNPIAVIVVFIATILF